MERIEWIYEGNKFTPEDVGDYYGFVYLITNQTNQKKYIGKKYFYSSKTKQVKGKKKRFKVPSDWEDYYGSNSELQKDVQLLGKDNFTREILFLGKTKGDCSYEEARQQFVRNVLIDESYYNTWIMVRVRRSHISKISDLTIDKG